MEFVQNIYCVGRNYRLHAEEMGNQVPTSPFLFSKPTHALVIARGQEIVFPSNRGAIHHELELVVHINKTYVEGMVVDDLVDHISLGIDFTLRDLQDELKQKRLPWLLAKGFRNSAVITDASWIAGIDQIKSTDFYLIKNGQEVQRGNINGMIFDLQSLIDFTGTHFGLGSGDILFTGTPAGVGAVENGDHLEMFLGDTSLGSCIIHLV